jgi:hypothetical protein
MESDVVKLLILVAIMAAIMAAGRISSGPPPNEDFKPLDRPEPENEPKQVPAVGTEIPFPFDIRELESEYGEAAIRPRILNYYFARTDLVRGPEDRDVFYDELSVEYHNDENNHRWTSTHMVVTPRGIERMMAEQSWRSLYGDGMIIVRGMTSRRSCVPRWNYTLTTARVSSQECGTRSQKHDRKRYADLKPTRRYRNTADIRLPTTPATPTSGPQIPVCSMPR